MPSPVSGPQPFNDILLITASLVLLLMISLRSIYVKRAQAVVG